MLQGIKSSIFCLFLPVFLYAASGETEHRDSTGKDKSPYQEFLDKKKETAEGMFNVYKTEDKLYFEIPLNLMGREMLIGSTVSEISDNGNAIAGSKPTAPLLFRFAKAGERILMTMPEKVYITKDPDSEIAKAIRKNAKDAIYKSFKIETYNEDSTAAVIDITDIFLSDDGRFSPFDPNSANVSSSVTRTKSFEAGKSYISGIKAFEDNVVIKSVLSYTYSLTGKKKTILEDACFSAMMTRSIVLLDSIPYRPRLTDSRIAIFPTPKLLYDDKAQRSSIIYLANRWRLEPSDPEAYSEGKKVEPLKPITFYIDSNFPPKWRKYIKEGVNQWSELFEEIGFLNAVQALDYPDNDPEFDPDNIKYSCVRYAPLPVENAMGPSWVDPRTGEIINASVYVYHDVIKLLNNWLFVQTAAADKRVRTMDIPEEIIGDALRYVISHEIGHCLGFMHNMGASSTFPTDSLRSPSFTSRYGTTPSIMDYARFNYIAQPGDFERGVKMTPPRFGEYDRFLVKWCYTPLPSAQDMWDEYEITSEWLKKASSNPVLRYGKQQSDVIDPRSQSEDLGDDPVKSSTYGINNLKYILKHMNEWIGDGDYDYSYRSQIYDNIIMQYFLYASHVYAQVGGINLYEKHAGDDVPRFRSLPAATQKEALEFLLGQACDLDWIDEPSVLKNMGIMGSPADLLRDMIMKMVISAPDKVELSASKAAEDPFTVKDCMDMVYEYIWGPTVRKEKLDATQMKLQKLFLKHVGSGASVKIGVSGDNSLYEKLQPKEPSVSGYEEPFVNYHLPQQYEGMYFGYILKVQSLLKKRAGANDETGLHYKFLLHNIEKALGN